MAGLGNNDRDFWSGLRGWDVITLVETWVEEKGWQRIRYNLPGEYVWEIQTARKRNRKRRAIRGTVMRIRKKLLEEETGFEKEREAIMMGRIRRGTERWKIVRVYAKKEGLEGTLEDLKRWAEKREEGIKTIVGGDFNARTRREGGGVEEKDDEDRKERKERRSKNGKLDKEEKILVFIEERG